MPTRVASASVCDEVTTPEMRNQFTTRAPSASIMAEEVDPVPSPTI